MKILIVSDYDCAYEYSIAEYVNGKIASCDPFGQSASAFDAICYLEAVLGNFGDRDYYKRDYPAECKIVDEWLATYDDIILCRDGGILTKKGK